MFRISDLGHFRVIPFMSQESEVFIAFEINKALIQQWPYFNVFHIFFLLTWMAWMASTGSDKDQSQNALIENVQEQTP